MQLASLDERDLLLPLYEGIHEQTLWQTFLRRLLARTEAQTVCLMVQTTPCARLPTLKSIVSNDPDGPTLNIERLSELGLIPYGSLRPNRVYALQEWLSFGDDEIRTRQREELASQSIAYGRFIRIASGGNNVWVILLHDRKDFGADDSALLSALAPHLCSALVTLVKLDGLRLRAAIAEGGLELLGVRQVALDREGHAVVDEGSVPDNPSGRWLIAPGASQLLTEACGALAGMPSAERRFVRAANTGAVDILVRPCTDLKTALPTAAAVVGMSRTSRHPEPAGAARIVAAAYGLSAREAALAERICRGQSIVEAGADLRLTPETARNYSKRIYAKTGVAGQADLVRFLLNGLAPMA